jgi:hypothetical protein
MKWVDRLIKGVPLDYQQGYEDGFNAALSVLDKTLKAMGKLDMKNVRKVEGGKQDEKK